MAEVGGMLAAAVLKMVGTQIGSVLGGKIPLHQHFGEELEVMKMTLETVSALLQDAEKRSMKDATVLLWLKRLKDAMYDIYNMLDEFEVDTKPSATKCTIMIPCLAIGPKMKTANKMKTISKKLENITKQHTNFGFKSEDISNVQQVICTDRQTSPKVEEASIVGRDQEKLKILNYLSNKGMTQDFIILPIYGIGGIGKTTLAQLVFNDKEFKEYSRVWVYVSQMFDLNKIESSIISQLLRSEPTITGLEMIPANMRILIVLDDLWENDGFKLDRLKLMLKIGKEAKVVVIVTTRNEDLAGKFCTVEPYKIEPLLDHMCWKIIKQKSAFANRDDKEQLEKIGREIAMKCGGVALAAQCLRYLLHSKRLDVWQSVKDSDIWKESTSEDTSSLDHVLASLKLSYISMMPCLKLCFGYCAIFPKGHKIIKDDLIYQWISLGFIQPSNISSPRQLGETYVTNLLGMSFLQQSPSPNGQHDEDDTFFTMHDLVHDLARTVMGDEILDTSSKCHNGESNCQYALLADCTIRLELYAKVRALRFLHSDKSVLVNDATFSTTKYLRVLDLKECSIHHLPASLGQLKLLRYLSAPGVQDAIIPKCITKLSKLCYLNLSGSSAILALPDSIGEMGSLLYLDLSDCSGIEELPESFSKLKNLVHLDLSNCSHVTRLSESLGKLTRLNYLNLQHCKNIGHPENSFGSLTQLQYLNLSCSSYIEVPSLDNILGSLTKLKYLNLSSEQERTVRFLHDNIEPEYLNSLPEGFGNCIELEYLNLSGCEYLQALPQSFGELINLVHLDLSGCFKVKGILEALHTLTKLRYLNLSRCSRYSEDEWHPDGLSEVLKKLMQLRYLNLAGCIGNVVRLKMSSERGPLVESILASISTLSNLEHLDLSNNYFVRYVPESICSLTRLHTLDLSLCIDLLDIPEGIADMDSLKFVHVNGCHALDKSRLIRVNKSLVMLPNFVVQAGEGEASSNLVLLKDLNPRHLEISSLEIVKSVEEVRRIKLREKQSMVNLKLEWTREAKGFVEDMEVLGELVPPSSLTEFTLKGYNGVSFPAWLMGIPPHNLPNIVKVELVGMSQCSSLPPLGQLPSLEWVVLKEIPMVTNIDRGFCGGGEAFSKLTMFSISDMDNLEEWTTTYSYGEDVVVESFMFPNLKMLKISNCHKLRLNPCPPRVAVMCITDSDGVLSPNWGESVHLPHSTTSSALVSTLEVTSCKAPMHQWRLLRHLPALYRLTISDCSDMPISPEINPAFFSFHELRLCGNDLAELPKWLEWLTSPKNLVITRYKALEGWNDFIRRCTSLESLHLFACQAMTSLPQWLGNLTSLRELNISYCDELDNLEGSIRQLSSLESLTLRGCGSIQALPEWLGDLISLKELEFRGLNGIVSLPESIRHLSSLESLTLCECGSIQALPEWFGDLKFLKKLEISKNNRIVSLPQSIQQLANLEKLHIWWCPALSQWCNSEENEMKIAHIREKKIDFRFI